MSTLLFLLTLLSLFVLFIILIIKALRRKPVVKTFLKILAIFAIYTVLWLVFFAMQANSQVPLGTDVCFDDWCATVTKAEKVKSISEKTKVVYPRGQFIILYVTMSNHARGIAQRPSEPRIHIIDDKGRSWACAVKPLQVLESTIGKQPGLDARLDLHQSLQTELVFDVAVNSKGIKALIEEGPFITRLLLPDNRQVFSLE